MASSITASEFKDALSRYSTVLKRLPAKEGQTSLEELDKFRYQYAPMNFSKNAGKTLDLEALQKLVEWKVRHGKYRPTLPKLVASNKNDEIASATTEAFDHYNLNKEDIAGTIEKLRALKGVGPATASLILAVYDPQNVIFFSDELYRWLVNDGKKVSLKYTTSEFEEVFSKAKSFMSRIKCTPIELEKVAFTLIQENEPVSEPKAKKEPSGRGRGRPPLPESEKKAKKVAVPGRGRGRPPGTTKVANGVAPKAKKEKKEKEEPEAEDGAAAKKRGRPVAKKVEATPASESADEEAEEEAKTPASKKRKSTGTPASGRSAKKTKA